VEPVLVLHDDPDTEEVTERTRDLFLGQRGVLGNARDPRFAEDDRGQHAQPILVGEITEDAGRRGCVGRVRHRAQG